MTSVCCVGLGEVGYVAAMEWSSVHEFRPRVSTSAGQSVAAAGADGVVLVFALGTALMDFAWAAHAEKALLEVQDRHLIDFVRKTARIQTHKLNLHEKNKRSFWRTVYHLAPGRHQEATALKAHLLSAPAAPEQRLSAFLWNRRP